MWKRINNLMVDISKDIKRTHYIRQDQDKAIKYRAIKEGIKASDVLQKALDAYLGLKEKK